REAKDEVEKIGIEKSKEMAKDADLIIAIFDSSKKLTEEDINILELIKDKQCIIVLNKIDLEQKINENTKQINETSKNIVKMSMKEQNGLKDLYKKISELFSFEKINVDNSTI